MIYRHTLTWVAIVGLIVLMFLRLPPMVAKQDALLNIYGPLVEVDALCRQQYVEPIHDMRLVEGAIRGMMLRLDPYSGYIAPNELHAFERRNEGDYTGVGLEIGYRRGRLMVIAPIENSPAARAGVRPGDVILSVNGVDVEGLSVFDVEELLVGPPGSTVTLRVVHREDREPTELTMRRGPVHVSSVRGFARAAANEWDYWIDPARRFGYIRVSNFRNNTTAEFDRVLRRLLKQGVRGLILDLRFNPGGIMHEAIAMVDRFVDHGLILSTVTRRRAVDQFRAHRSGTVSDLPLAVLVNGGSASAAEIVSGSLQAHHRAAIVGERTFGKGSVQHVIHLTEHDAAVKLTTAYYRLPDGRIIHRTPRNADSDAWGVLPDVIVELTDEEERHIRARRKELDLAFIDAPAADALPASDRAGSHHQMNEEDEPRDEGLSPVAVLRSLPIDRQLQAALDVLGRAVGQDESKSH